MAVPVNAHALACGPSVAIITGPWLHRRCGAATVVCCTRILLKILSLWIRKQQQLQDITVAPLLGMTPPRRLPAAVMVVRLFAPRLSLCVVPRAMLAAASCAHLAALRSMRGHCIVQCLLSSECLPLLPACSLTWSWSHISSTQSSGQQHSTSLLKVSRPAACAGKVGPKALRCMQERKQINTVI